MQKGVNEYRNEQVKEGLSYFGCFWLIVDVMCREKGKRKPENRKKKVESEIKEWRTKMEYRKRRSGNRKQ